MKRRAVFPLLLTVMFPLTLAAGQGEDRCPGQGLARLVGVIPVPGNPIISSDIGWVDPQTERYYIADRSNFGVDIIDAENDVYVGRVSGMAGPLPSGGGTSTTNGPGPNGVLVTPEGILWAGDGNSTVTVANVDPSSPMFLSIVGSVSTAIAACDGGDETSHYCGRADELGYDPKHHIILVANNAPLDVAAPHDPIDPFATFISTDPPYLVRGFISFPGAGGLEQPLWDPGIRGGRFLLTVPGKLMGSVVLTPPKVVVIDPLSMAIENTYALDCEALAGTVSASITGIALGRSQHILVSACGFPITLNARTGQIYNVIFQVGGGDEVWYNRGNDRFFVTGADQTGSGLQSLGEIDARTSSWLQNVTDVRGKNPAAFAENNHVFTVVQITQAIVMDPSTDDSTCAQFGVAGTGCIAVFVPEEIN
jgi:hypothetical protein